MLPAPGLARLFKSPCAPRSSRSAPVIHRSGIATSLTLDSVYPLEPGALKFFYVPGSDLDIPLPVSVSQTAVSGAIRDISRVILVLLKRTESVVHHT